MTGNAVEFMGGLSLVERERGRDIMEEREGESTSVEESERERESFSLSLSQRCHCLDMTREVLLRSCRVWWCCSEERACHGIDIDMTHLGTVESMSWY